MGEEKIVLGFVGSPNKAGLTSQLVKAALNSAESTGAPTELVQMSDHIVDACKDCLPWECQENLKCTYGDDAFEYLSQKVLNCGGLIIGTPVYWWDTSGMVKYFILKMFRVYARSAPLLGVPAFGISIAGGSGNGLVSGLRPVYHFYQVMQMRALEPLPVTRFNFDLALDQAKKLGNKIAGMRKKRNPFASLEERLLWYDDLPYLGLSRAAERRLLADQIAMATPNKGNDTIQYGLAQADAFEAANKKLESLKEISNVYEVGLEAFESK